MRADQRGLTLVEVMVSLFLASLVIVGGYAVMATQQRISRQQTQVQASQQALWVAMELVQRDLRKAGAGFGSCRYQELSGFVNRSVFEAWRRVDGAATRYYALTVVDGGANGTDELIVTWASPRSGGLADARLNDQSPAATGIWAVGTSVALFPNVVGENKEEAFMFPVGCDCAGGSPVCVVPDGSAARPFPLALLRLDPTVAQPNPPVPCSLVQVTGVGSIAGSGCVAGTVNSPVLTTAQQATAPWNRASGGTGGTVYTNTMQAVNLGDITRVRWYVQPTAVTGLCTRPPCLVRATIAVDDVQAPQVIASGIEDLQLAPACDVNGDGAVGLEGTTDVARQADEWFNNVAGETVTIASTGCLTYPQVRLSIVARTSSQDPGYQPQPRPALENHAAASTGDGFRRRILSAVVAPPNIGI